MSIPNHLDLVRAVKAELEGKQVELTGPCGAFEITKRVAWALREEGAGLLDKLGGSNCHGFATDIVCYRNGDIVDILGDGGGANNPAWAVKEKEVDPSRWRKPIDPGEAPGGSGDGGGPQPKPTESYPGDMKGVEIGTALFADYAEKGETPNAGMGVWFWRTAWDAAHGLTVDASIAKHRAEWRRTLGLP
jgi:hypothetical protein